MNNEKFKIMIKIKWNKKINNYKINRKSILNLLMTNTIK